VVSIAGQGDQVCQTTEIDRNIERVVSGPRTARPLVVGANDGTTVGLWVKPLDGPARRMKLGNLTPLNAYWVEMNLGSKDEVALTATSPERATELYYLPTLDSAPVRLTDFNAGLDESGARQATETVTWGPATRRRSMAW
jgi:hypothetical protein